MDDQTTGSTLPNFGRPKPPAPRYPNPMPVAVRIGDQILVFRNADNPSDRSPRCVAQIGRKGNRCPRDVRHPDDLGHHNEEWSVPGTGGVIRTSEPARSSHQCYIQQRCHKHVGSDAPNAIAPTWELFDPLMHADVIQFRAVPTWTPSGLKYVDPSDAITRSPARPDQGDVSRVLRKALETRVEPPVVTAMYSYYDADDLLLYVGITDNLAMRQSAHVKSSSWMEFAVRATIERFGSRKEAELTEQDRIKAHRPLFNSKHNDAPDAVSRLVEYLIKHGRTDLLAPAVSRG